MAFHLGLLSVTIVPMVNPVVRGRCVTRSSIQCICLCTIYLSFKEAVIVEATITHANRRIFRTT